VVRAVALLLQLRPRDFLHRDPGGWDSGNTEAGGAHVHWPYAQWTPFRETAAVGVSEEVHSIMVKGLPIPVMVRMPITVPLSLTRRDRLNE
jgi:hypothetical protein